MLKIKDNVDLTELEKYGFEYRERTKEYYFNIDGNEYLEIPTNKESEYYKQVRLFFEDDYYNCWTGNESFDKLYDLIKDGLVEKVDN